MAELNQGQKKFLDQYTRKFLVEWAYHYLVHDRFARVDHENLMFLDHAITKGWVSKDKSKVTSKGYATATSFLK